MLQSAIWPDSSPTITLYFSYIGVGKKLMAVAEGAWFEGNSLWTFPI